MPTIVLTGGGTAGHVLPHIALLPFLREKFDRVIYVGGDGVERDLAKANGIPFYRVTTVKLRRKLTLKNLLIPFRLLKGIREAKQILRKVKPDIVFSKGGFVALPVVYAAASLGIKVIAHESDMSLGLANRLTAKKCTVVATTFPLKDQRYHNLVQTGAIIRPSIYRGDARRISLPSNGLPNLLVMGGSLGAAAINNAVSKALPKLCRCYNVLHLTGRGKALNQPALANYQQVEYLVDPADALAWADIVVARSGSGTVSELLALRKPAVYIPLPKTESRGDQIENAEYLQSLGVGVLLPQTELTTERLLGTIDQVYAQSSLIKANCAKQTWIDGTAKILSYLQRN